MNQFFDTIGGLPLHPLIVHAASVLIPLSAVALVLLVFVPKWRKTFLPLTVGALAVSVVLSFVAKQSGEALAERVGNPSDHQALGDLLFPASVGLFFLGLAFYFLTKSNQPKWALQLAGGLSTAAVAAVLVLAVLVGHSGAQATWGNRISETQGQEITAPTTPTPGTTTNSGSTTKDSGISLAEIKKHNSVKDCWTVVKGNVYDITSYISRHEGGASVLTAICGKDGTKAFTGQHATEQRPNADLSSLLLGRLSAASVDTGAPSAKTSTGAPSTKTSTGAPSVKTLTAAEVLKHKTGSDCWSVIKGTVYDLTSYVNSHPGGAALIKAICGKDGSAAFAGEHGSAGKPNNILAGFALGPLVSGSKVPEAAVRGYDEDDDDDDKDDDKEYDKD